MEQLASLSSDKIESQAQDQEVKVKAVHTFRMTGRVLYRLLHIRILCCRVLFLCAVLQASAAVWITVGLGGVRRGPVAPSPFYHDVIDQIGTHKILMMLIKEVA